MTFDMNPDDDRHEWELMVAEIASLKADNARLREAIDRESEKHNIFNKPECDCTLCQIAREGR